MYVHVSFRFTDWKIRRQLIYILCITILCMFALQDNTFTSKCFRIIVIITACPNCLIQQKGDLKWNWSSNQVVQSFSSCLSTWSTILQRVKRKLANQTREAIMVNEFDWSIDHVMTLPIAIQVDKQPEKHCTYLWYASWINNRSVFFIVDHFHQESKVHVHVLLVSCVRHTKIIRKISTLIHTIIERNYTTHNKDKMPLK